MKQEATLLQQQVHHRKVLPNSAEDILFQNGSALRIDRQNPVGERLELISADGVLQLSIEMTPNGANIQLSGRQIQIAAKEKLELKSPHIHIQASETLALESEQDITQNAKRDFFSKARIQNIEADLGNVNIKANDDVRVDGERVKLNCTD